MWKITVTAILGTCLAFGQTTESLVNGSFDLLKKSLQDPSPERRRMAAAALGSAGANTKVIQLLYDAMATDKDPAVRQAAVNSLGEMKAQVAIPKLKAAIESDPPVAFAAARAMWIMGDRSGRDLIEEVATGKQKKTSSMVGDAKLEANRRMHDPNGLAKMGAEEVAGMLLGPFSIGLKLATDLSKDSGAQGRLLAITLLSQQCDAGSVAAFESAALEDKNEIVRAGGMKALGICGGKEEVAKLGDAIASEKYVAQLAAAATIIRLSDKPAGGMALLKKKR